MCLYYSDTVYLYNGAHDTVDTMYTLMLTTLCYWFIGYTHWTFYKNNIYGRLLTYRIIRFYTLDIHLTFIQVHVVMVVKYRLVQNVADCTV